MAGALQRRGTEPRATRGERILLSLTHNVARILIITVRLSVQTLCKRAQKTRIV